MKDIAESVAPRESLTSFGECINKPLPTIVKTSTAQKQWRLQDHVYIIMYRNTPKCFWNSHVHSFHTIYTRIVISLLQVTPEGRGGGSEEAWKMLCRVRNVCRASGESISKKKYNYAQNTNEPTHETFDSDPTWKIEMKSANHKTKESENSA